jgi:hypothetical protein
MYNGLFLHLGKTSESDRFTLWLKPDALTPAVDFSITDGSRVGFNLKNYEFQTNRWYHIAYTLSDPEKRMNLYIDGKWVGSCSLTLIQNQSIIFNDGPLYIGNPFSSSETGIIGYIRYLSIQYYMEFNQSNVSI